MASSSTSFCPPNPLTGPRAAVLRHSYSNPTALLFPVNSRSKPLTKLTLKTAAPPLPLKVLCSRESRDDKTAKYDPVYRNRLVNMFVNRILKGGKKSLAYQIIYRALKRIHERTKLNPLAVLRQAVIKVTPEVTLKARRVGGSTYQIPVEIGSAQGKALAIRWLLQASRQRQGKSMVVKLSSEVMDAASGTGNAIRQKESTHKMAEANRAFSHFPAEVCKNSWEKSILKSDVPVLVEFYASWCGPCRMVHRVIEEIAGDYYGRLKCFILNTDTDLQIAEDYEIKAVPVVLLFKNGEKRESVVGTMPKEFYVAAIERVLQS